MALLGAVTLASCDGGGPVALDVPGVDAVDPGGEGVDSVSDGSADDPGRETVDEVAAFDDTEAGDSGAEACAPTCGDHNCGDDGCGGSCGTCEVGWQCMEGHCAIVDVGNCTFRECGSDEMGGTCGTCIDGTVCDELRGKCVYGGPWPPVTTWGPAGVASQLQTPADAAVIASTCFDYTGDGAGDNGLKALASQVNGPLATLVAPDTTMLLFELQGVADFANTASFPLNGLRGRSAATPPATSGDFRILEGSYNADLGLPVIRFEGASIAEGRLAAGPANFQLSIPVQTDLVIDVTLIQAQVKGDILPGASADGFELQNGVLSGVLTKQQMDTAIAKLQASCDAAPAAAKPDFCKYLQVSVSAFNVMFDLHQNGDGTFSAKSKDLPGDAASVCLSYRLSKARIVGYQPVATP